MMKIRFKLNASMVSLMVVLSVLTIIGCNRDYEAYEWLSGSWFIEKAEILTITNGEITATKTYNDSCGYILLFNGNPGHVYSEINYPSGNLSTDHDGNWWPLDWEDGYYTITLNSRTFTVNFNTYKMKKQVWKFPESVVNGVQEVVYLKRK